MKALTIRQPWAWAVAEGLKLVENRNRPPPKAMLGQVFAVHAAATPPPGDHEDFLKSLKLPIPPDYEVHAILAVAQLVGVVEDPSVLPKAQRPFFFGPFGWVLTNVRKLAEPVPVYGQLGFWNLDPEVEAEVRAQL
jgi:hypothetical protein